MGSRESLDGGKNKARRKVKKGEKSPWGQCLTRPVPNGHRRFGFWLVPEKHKVFWHQSEARTAATVWNWSGKTLSPGALLAFLYFSFVPYFFARLDFPSSPLSAPGSPRMRKVERLYFAFWWPLKLKKNRKNKLLKSLFLVPSFSGENNEIMK